MNSQLVKSEKKCPLKGYNFSLGGPEAKVAIFSFFIDRYPKLFSGVHPHT